MIWARRISLLAMAAFYVIAGTNHFVNPDFYRPMMPPELPAHDLLIWLSGEAELVIGVGLLIPETRRWAAWGAIALLLAVVPANIYIAAENVPIGGASEGAGVWNWVRVVLFQPLLIVWAWWHTRPDPGSAGT